jgi:ATP-dependent Clp protease ATP-binding subunit ClpX
MPPNNLKCSFCKKPRNEVKALVVANEDAGLCICISCNKLIEKQFEASVKKGGFEEAKKEEPLAKPREIRAYLDKYVIGQDRAKTDISIAVYNHFKRRKFRNVKPEDGSDPVRVDKSNIVMLGPSGSGKTYIARTIAKLLKVPFHVGDATRLTQAGYVGDDVESLVQGLILDAGGDIERAQWGIIFLDEVDKIARGSGRDRAGYRDVSGEGVQQSLLKLLEGSKISVPRGNGRAGMATTYDTVDTSDILFICGGSFAGIEPIIEKRVNKGVSRLGFGASTEKKKLTITDAYSAANEDDLMEFGIIPEMMGRLPVITSTIELTEEEMVRVLNEPNDSLVKQMKSLFQMDGINLDFTEDALQEIAKEAKKRPTGARALRSVMENTLKPFSYDSPSDDSIERIVVTADTVRGGPGVITIREQKIQA